ncbi:MAG: HD domain-containing protein [Candidatus Margulisiibacteriota bacterium]
MFTVKKGAAEIIQRLKTGGFRAYLVGGSLRDLLLGKTPEEWDITTNARPAEVTALFPKVIPTGILYGTVTVLLPDGPYEVTTFRADEKYVDGRHPSNVRFTNDLQADLARRDFTVNALAYDPETKELFDDFAGQADLNMKIIRAVGDPLARFSEDGLRPVRACRFAATLGFTIDGPTFDAIRPTLAVVRQVAPERLHDELVKLLKAEKPSLGLEYMRESGLLDLILPELATCYGVAQPPEYHKYDVYWHSLYACDAAPKNNLTVRLAALLHDIGKPACKVDDTFYRHDQTGAELAATFLRRLKFSNAESGAVVNLITNHMFNYESGWSDAAVRRFIRRAGLDNLPNLFALRRADTAAMEQELGAAYLNELQGRIDRIVADENALHVADLKIDGQAIMLALNIPPGPKVGQILNALLEKVLDDPQLNDRETLLKMIKADA